MARIRWKWANANKVGAASQVWVRVWRFRGYGRGKAARSLECRIRLILLVRGEYEYFTRDSETADITKNVEVYGVRDHADF